MNEIKERIEKELTSKLNSYRRYAIGGQLRIDIERATIDAANTDMFAIIINDTSGRELYRKELDFNVPEVSLGEDNWWNIKLLSLDKKIRPPFYVYVVDRLEDKPFKFILSAIK